MKDEFGGAARCVKAILAALFLVAVADSARASVEISSSPTRHMRCVSGTCSPTDKVARLNVNDLTNMLATSDVKVTTGHGAVTITVSAPFTWTSGSRLTLDANLDVSFRAQVEIAGTGGLTIVTNDGGTGGDILFFDGGVVDFWDTTSSLIVNGNSYALVDTLPALIDAVKANPAGYYALSKSYNAAKTRVYKTSPIKTFGGTFEGLGHAISNLAIQFSSTKHVQPATGMFSVSTGTIRDIALTKASVTSTAAAGIVVGDNEGQIISVSTDGSISSNGSAVGGVAGSSSGTITTSSSTARVAGGTSGAGGLVGFNSATVAQSSAAGVVAGFNNGGGLIGVNEGTIVQSHATATMSTQQTAGGLVGDNDGGTISLSYSHTAITAGLAAGGLAGINVGGGLITQSWSDGNIQGNNAGGLVGSNYDGIPTIIDCYSTGSATGDDAGGLTGYNDAAFIKTSYSTGHVSWEFANAGGGLTGSDYNGEANITSSYWDTDTSGITDLSKGAGNVPYDPGIEGFTSAELSSALPLGFDPNVWAENSSINDGLPYLLANPPTQALKAKKIHRLLR